MARAESFESDHSRDNLDKAPDTDASLFNRFEKLPLSDAIENTIWHKPSDFIKGSSLQEVIVNLQELY